MDLKYSLKDVLKAFEMNGLRQILRTKYFRIRKFVGTRENWSRNAAIRGNYKEETYLFQAYHEKAFGMP